MKSVLSGFQPSHITMMKDTIKQYKAFRFKHSKIYQIFIQ